MGHHCIGGSRIGQRRRRILKLRGERRRTVPEVERLPCRQIVCDAVYVGCGTFEWLPGRRLSSCRLQT